MIQFKMIPIRPFVFFINGLVFWLGNMERKIMRFLDITELKSTEIAKYYLEVSNGNLEAAVAMFYEDDGEAPKMETPPRVATTAPSSIEKKPSQTSSSELLVLEWNIQGLLDDCLRERTIAMAAVVDQNKPSAILLQEVTVPIYSYLKSALKSDYDGFSSVEFRPDACPSYFTAIFVSRRHFSSCRAHVTLFHGSSQGRDLLVVNGKFCGREVILLTSHLESTKPGETERKRQLAHVYKVMAELPENGTAIFGGDTNLRDAEFNSVVQAGEFDLTKVNDLWNMLGCPQHARYSWDLQKNDNQIKNGKARLRFERMYVRVEKGETGQYFQPKDIKFVGTERLPCGMFPSDHWGLLATFST